mgnify:CR=1 FL=1
MKRVPNRSGYTDAQPSGVVADGENRAKMEKKFEEIKKNSEVLDKINKEVKDAHIKKSDVYNTDSLMQMPWEPKSPLLEFGL